MGVAGGWGVVSRGGNTPAKYVLGPACLPHLQAATAPAQPSLSVEEQLAGAEAAHKHVDSALAAQLSAAEARIKRLEAELAVAKAEAGALRAQRSAAEQDHHRVVEQLTSGAAAAASAQAAGAVAAALEAGLGAARALQGAIEGAAGTKPAAHDAGAADALVQRLVAQEVPAKLVGAVQQVVDLNLALLQDLGGKAAFYRERLAQVSCWPAWRSWLRCIAAAECALSTCLCHQPCLFAPASGSGQQPVQW